MATKFTGGIDVGRADYQIFPPDSLDKILLGINLRDEADYGDLEQFARELFDPDGPGQLQPGVIRKSPDGQPVLVAGFRRLQAIRLGNLNPSLYGGTGPLGFKATTIRCSEDEALLYNLAENRQRQDLSPVSLAKAARYLIGQKGWSHTQVAKALGFQAIHYVAQLLDYLDLPEEARHALHIGLMPEYVAKSFKGLPEREIKEAVKQIETGAAKPADVKRGIDQRKRSNGVRVSLSLKEIRDRLKAKEHDSYLAADLLTCFDGQHIRTLEQIIDLYESDPEQLEAHEEEFQAAKEKAARVDQLEVELETVLNWIANNLGDDTRDLAEKELQQARELAAALAGIGAKEGEDDTAGVEGAES